MPAPAVAPATTATPVCDETDQQVWRAYLAYRGAERYTLALVTIIVVAVLVFCFASLLLVAGFSSAFVLSFFCVAALLLGTASVLRFTEFGKNNVEPLITGVATTCLMSIPAVTPVALGVAQSLLDVCMQANQTDPQRTLAVPANSTIYLGFGGVIDFGCKSFAERGGGEAAFGHLLFWLGASVTLGGQRASFIQC